MTSPSEPIPIPELDSLQLVLATHNVFLISLNQFLPGNVFNAIPGTWTAHIGQCYKKGRPPPSYAYASGNGPTPSAAIRDALDAYRDRIARNRNRAPAPKPASLFDINLNDLDI